MKHQLFGAVALAALAAAPAFAQTIERGPYVRFSAGGGFASNHEFEGPGTLDGNAQGPLNYRVAAALGYKWNDSLRFEVDVSDRFNNLGAPFEIDGSDADIHNTSVLFNAIVDLLPGSPVRPYVGFGVGPGVTTLDAEGASIFPGIDSGVFVDDTEAHLAVNALTGITYNLTERFIFDAGYRYVRLLGLDFDTTTLSPAGVSVATTGTTVTSADFHEFLFGLRYQFGRVSQPPPPAAPPPPPPPPAAAPPPPPPPTAAARPGPCTG
ncbi:MAG: outer membrane protein, partial [Maricaulaceae bacterium]